MPATAAPPILHLQSLNPFNPGSDNDFPCAQRLIARARLASTILQSLNPFDPSNPGSYNYTLTLTSNPKSFNYTKSFKSIKLYKYE